MIIGFEDSLRVMMEQQEFDISRDRIGPVNRFKKKTRLTGIVLSDTYNNPFFPIKFGTLKIDKARMNIVEIRREFRRIYKSPKIFMLPWHFYIELIGDEYFIFNTRPINMKFPMRNNEVPEENAKDDKTELFLSRNLFDISELIHVVICGDTYSDIYPKRFYEVVGSMCISPLLRLNNLPMTLHQRVFPLGLGGRFDLGLLEKYLII